MELVEKSSCLDAHVANCRPSLDEKLDLFLQICDGVHHAHQKGIIHRDLKPGNVLIDQAGRVKLIDFGIAKSLVPSRTEKDGGSTGRNLTSAGHIVGTPAYMSPEQTTGQPELIDVRSDVYSLGVILYELCTDALPYDVKNVELARAIVRIRSREPEKRPLEDAGIPTDLQIIIGKALAKEVDHRFESVAAFSSDIRRFIRLEPIDARPPSVLYQLSRFSARNKGLVISGAAVFLTLAIGAIATTWGLVNAQRARDNAEAERDRSNMLLMRTEEAERQATSAREFAGDLLYSNDPWETPGSSDLTVRQQLDRASRRLEREIDIDPHTEMEARRTLARVYDHLSVYDSAEYEYERALELADDANADHETRCALLNDLVPVLLASDKTSEAAKRSQESLALHHEVLGADDPRTWEAMSNQAQVVAAQGNLVEARGLHAEVIALRVKHYGPNHPATLEARSLAIGVSHQMGDLAGAEAAYRELLERYVEALGPKHPETMFARRFLLSTIIERRGYEEADVLLAELIADSREVLGADHEQTMASVSERAALLRRLGRLEEALPLAESALAWTRTNNSETHYNTLRQRSNMALLLNDLGRTKEAEAMFAALANDWRQREADPEASYLVMAINYAHLLEQQDRVTEAIQILREFRERAGKEFPEGFWLHEVADERIARMADPTSTAKANSGNERARALRATQPEAGPPEAG
jgi:tetratricopeptide (TPR) repeat protein